MNDWFDAEHHVERAHELYELGRWGEAESELREALSRNPYQPEWHFNLGLTLEAAGHHGDAAESFARSHELNGEDHQAALLAGVSLLRANQARAALPWLDKARDAAPESSAPFVHRIEAHARLDEHDQAEVAFYLGQQLNPDDAELYCAMADSLMDRRLHDKAVWCLREAARLDQDTPRLQARLAEAYAATGRRERARQLYLRELQRDPGDIDTLLDLGCLLVEMHRRDEAGEKFRRVLEIEPANIDAHFYLGDLAEQRGEPDAALRQYEVVLRLDATYPETRRRVAGLILARVRAGDLTQAHRLLRMDLRDLRERAHDFSDEDIEQLGRLLLDARLPREALEVFKVLIERQPQVARHHQMLGVIRFELGRHGAGVESTRRALELDPRLVPAIHNLALSFLQQGRWLRARYWVRQGLAIEPEDQPLRRLRLRLRLRAIAEVVRWFTRPLRRRRGITA